MRTYARRSVGNYLPVRGDAHPSFVNNLTLIILDVSDVYRAAHPDDLECVLLARWLDRAPAAEQQHGVLGKSASPPSRVGAGCLYRMLRQFFSRSASAYVRTYHISQVTNHLRTYVRRRYE